jgi:hypothetical protein
MTEHSPTRLPPDQARLAFALGDMLQAAAAARLLDRQTDVHARRALATAVSVCYARRWLDSNLGGKLKAKWLPAAGAERDLHKRLLKLRRQTYAHTDPGGGRKPWVLPGPNNQLGVGESWTSLSRAELSAIADLCDRQAARIREALAAEADAARGLPPASWPLRP